MDKYLPPPAWFWELFNNIFEGDYGWVGAFLKVSVVAPVVEELIFRGLILQGFRRKYNAFVAVLMSALLFALFHLNPWQFPATFVLGLLLGWLVVRTNNIILSIIGHSVNNTLVLLTITFPEQIHSHAIYLIEKKQLYFISSLVVLLSLILIFFLTIKWLSKTKSK